MLRVIGCQANIFSMTIANAQPGLQNCQGEGEGEKQKLHVKDLMEQHAPYVVLHFTSWEQRLAV